MQTFKEMQDELIWRIKAAKNSTLYPTSRIKSLLTDSYQWATTMFIWDGLVRAKDTDSEIFEYYDYPTDFRDNSIIRLIYNDEEYERKNFEDYLDYKKQNPTSTKKIFANFGRQFFIFPTPAVAGNDLITVWGAIQAPTLINDADLTIFSTSNSVGNEAIVQKAFSVSCLRSNPNLSSKEETSALGKLNVLFTKQQKEKQRDQRLDHPSLSVSDMFGSANRNPGAGKF